MARSHAYRSIVWLPWTFVLRSDFSMGTMSIRSIEARFWRTLPASITDLGGIYADGDSFRAQTFEIEHILSGSSTGCLDKKQLTLFLLGN